MTQPSRSTSIVESRIPALDGLRGLAILMVMLFHFSVVLDPRRPIENLFRIQFATLCWTGVDLFFVLSGFLITGILLDTRDAQNYFSAFYARRMLRIFPLYYFSLLVIFLAFHPHRLAWYAVYAENWRSINIGVATHFWSLAVEEQFYLIWPLVVYHLHRHKILQAAGTGILVCWCLRPALLAAHVAQWTVYTNPFTRMDALLWGAVCACLVRDPAWLDRLRPHARWLWLAPAAAVAIQKFSPIIGEQRPTTALGYPAISLSYAALIMSAVLTAGSSSALQRFLASAPMKTLGRYSYGAYVWQLLVIGQVRGLETSLLHRAVPGILNIPILIAATLAVSMASYVAIERPFLRLKSRFEPAAPATVELVLAGNNDAVLSRKLGGS